MLLRQGKAVVETLLGNVVVRMVRLAFPGSEKIRCGEVAGGEDLAAGKLKMQWMKIHELREPADITRGSNALPGIL